MLIAFNFFCYYIWPRDKRHIDGHSQKKHLSLYAIIREYMLQTETQINFEDLFRFNYRPLCLYALHYLQDVDLAEDIVQESYTALWERLHEGIHVLNRKSYLYMMVRNRCLDHLRKKGIPTESLKPYDTYGIIDDDDAQERSETEARLWTALESLPEKCREIFILSKRDGLKYEEIAEELGLSVNTVRNQISKALKVLKEGVHKIYMFFFA